MPNPNPDLEIVIVREPLPVGRQGLTARNDCVGLPRTLQGLAMTEWVRVSGPKSEFGPNMKFPVKKDGELY